MNSKHLDDVVKRQSLTLNLIRNILIIILFPLILKSIGIFLIDRSYRSSDQIIHVCVF